MLILFSQTRILLVRKLCYTSLKTTKLWSRWSSREEALQGYTFPEPTELLLIGCLIESIWTPRSKSSTLTPKTQLAYILTKGNFHTWWVLCLFNISHFSSINSVKSMSKRTPEDAGEERVTAKSKPMMNLESRCRARDPTVLASIASENLVNTNLNDRMYLWVR